MSVTIDATVGGAAANAYVTEAEQIAYMATRLNASAWTTLTGSTCLDTEKQAMVEAQRWLTALRWFGERANSAQALAWPRIWAPDPDSPNGYAFSSTIIPQRVKDAACELAFQFLKAGGTDIAALDAKAGVIEETIDVITTKWDRWNVPQGLAAFPTVTRYIARLVPGGGNVTSVVRG